MFHAQPLSCQLICHSGVFSRSCKPIAALWRKKPTCQTAGNFASHHDHVLVLGNVGRPSDFRNSLRDRDQSCRRMAASFFSHHFSSEVVTIFGMSIQRGRCFFYFVANFSKAVRIFVSTTYRVYAGFMLPCSSRMRSLTLLLCLPLLQPFVAVPRPLPQRISTSSLVQR